VPSNPNAPVSRSEIDAIRARISQFYNPPIGAQNAENLIVELRIGLGPDGAVRDVRIMDLARYRVDEVFRAAADSAVRAVRRATPLPIPAGKYEQFRDFVLEFDPRQALGRG
jgi:hypothetical protein